MIEGRQNKTNRHRQLNKTIEVGRILYASEVNGPGRRAVIWVQGCGKRCKGCFNPDFLPREGGTSMTPDDLIRDLQAHTDDFKSIEGITLSGGEPFDQAEALIPFANEIRKHNLSVMAFSGYTIAELRNDRNKNRLLNLMDILVDGEYIESLACARLWRSSFNQTVYLLTSRYRYLAEDLERPEQEMEIMIEHNRLTITGFPSPSGGSDLFTTD